MFKEAVFSDSSLLDSIHNQDCSVDKLLDYNGPQVIAIQGCPIRWYESGKVPSTLQIYVVNCKRMA